MQRKVTSIFILLSTVLLLSFATLDSSDSKNPIAELPVKRVLTNKDSDNPALEPIDRMMKRVMTSLKLTGATVGVVKDEKLVYTKGFGYADKENQKAVDPSSLFRIGSVSKLITAIAILKLVDDGKIGLDDYVFGEDGILKGKKYSGIQNRNLYKIKVKHLLNHTAGWSLITYGDPMFIPKKIHNMDKVNYPIDFDEVIHFVITRHLPYKPGTHYNYSNFGYCLLGRVIEEKMGQDYEAWVQKNILKPNGINNMLIAGNFEKDRVKNEVKYYDYSPDNKALAYNGSGKLVDKPYGADDIVMLGPAGGWLSNSIDMMRLLVMVDGYSKRYKDILSKDSMDNMIKGVGGVKQPLGWRNVDGEHWYRSGTLSGTSALLTRDLNGISWVIISNTTPRRGSFWNTSRWALREAFKEIKNWPSTDLF
ncbi:MAG: CubicO group peptidase (beta-lactamase class C family), partial [Roseivirga sp.]